MSAGKAASIIRIMYDKNQGDPRFLRYVAEKIKR